MHAATEPEDQQQQEREEATTEEQPEQADDMRAAPTASSWRWWSSWSSTSAATAATTPSTWGWVGGWWKSWRPTSAALLAQAEARMLRGVSASLVVDEVDVEGDGIAVPHTVHTVRLGQGPPLVLLHGFAASVGHWACNLDELAKHHTVYAIDLVGFGRSSRPHFQPESAEQAEDFFVSSIEGWRKKVGLERFTLLGHSFGGYLAGCYSLQHPGSVEALILADPWGLPRRTEEDAAKAAQLPWKWRLAKTLLQNFSPLAAVRLAGPYGPSLIHRVRPDLSSKWVHFHKEGGSSEIQEEHQSLSGLPTDGPAPPTTAAAIPPVIDYVYHSNAQVPPTGELAFHKLMSPIGWAARPLSERLHQLDASIPVTFLYGEESWMDPRAAVSVMKQLTNTTDIIIIPRAGHHVYVDNVAFFNRAVLKATLGANHYTEEDKARMSADFLAGSASSAEEQALHGEEEQEQEQERGRAT